MDLTNREVFFKTKEKLQKLKIDTISDSEINHLLMKANRFRTFSELVLNFEKPMQNQSFFDRSLNRIINGEPIQYVVESAPFLSFDFYVNKNVLIPRPETEGLVLYVKSIIEKNNINHDVIGDICTGSGCIALTLKSAFNESKVYGVDLFEDCLNVANYNKEMYRIDVTFLRGDKFEPFLKNKIRLDVLVSNPPYVENEDDIDPLVKNNEPMTAVYSQDGTAFYEWYFRRHKSFMNKDKFLMAFEINYDQEIKLTKLIKKYFRNENVKFKFVKDIYGLTRYLFIVKGYENEIIL